MSWDKCTINLSKLDSVKEILDELKVPYKLTILGEVDGRGLNDDSFMGTANEDVMYKLRRLEYNDNVVLEKMVQDADCDSDDYVVSEKFKLSNEPKDWKTIEKTDIYDDHPCWICNQSECDEDFDSKQCKKLREVE